MSTRDYKISNNCKQQISATLKRYNTSPKGVLQRMAKSKRMQEYYATKVGREEKVKASFKQSATMKQLISDGKFTPCITNTWTHWKACIVIDGTKRHFRSSWEACFWLCNQHCDYETIRVSSGDRVFVSDFFDKNTKTMYEIKPRNRYNIEIKKMTTLQNYCKQKNIRFIWVNENNIKKYINESLFTGENILQLNQLKKAWKNLK